MFHVRSVFSPPLRRTAVVLAALASGGGAHAALPQFTLDPTAVGLAGTSFTADNLLISDYSTVTFGSGASAGTFTDTGLLSVSALQLGGTTLIPTGLNSSYGLYIRFNSTGTTTTGDPTTTATAGNFNSLTYEIYGYNGSATFGVDASTHTPFETASGEVLLASGSLVNGGVSTMPTNPTDGTFVPTASAQLSFNTASGAAGFFADPVPFYNVALTAFTNTTSQVSPFAGGFSIAQGGGSVNFASPIPEPGTYALMLAGLGVMGFMARRRQSS